MMVTLVRLGVGGPGALPVVEPPEMNECLTLDLDSTLLFKQRSRLSQAQYTQGLKNSSMYQLHVHEAESYIPKLVK